jgi:hypothetical protein
MASVTGAMQEAVLRDRSLDAEEMSEVQAYERHGLELLGFPEKGASPAEVQQAILGKVDSVRETPDQIDPEACKELALTLACLWGQIICGELGWEWALVTFNEGDFYAIVTRNRSHAILPLHYFDDLIKDREADPTSLLIYNMLKAGDLPPAEAGAYRLLG